MLSGEDKLLIVSSIFLILCCIVLMSFFLWLALFCACFNVILISSSVRDSLVFSFFRLLILFCCCLILTGFSSICLMVGTADTLMLFCSPRLR